MLAEDPSARLRRRARPLPRPHVAELLTSIRETPGGAGDLVDPEDPATVGRILSEVGTVLVDDLAGGLQWSLGRTLYALSVLEERLRPSASASPGSPTARSPSFLAPVPP